MVTTKTLSIELDAEILAALDKFIADHGRALTPDRALRMILMDALISYGIAPLDIPTPVNPKDAH